MSHGPNPTHLMFLKYSFMGTQMHSFVYVLSLTDFPLQLQNWVVATETGPHLKVLVSDSLPEKFVDIWHRGIPRQKC